MYRFRLYFGRPRIPAGRCFFWSHIFHSCFPRQYLTGMKRVCRRSGTQIESCIIYTHSPSLPVTILFGICIFILFPEIRCCHGLHFFLFGQGEHRNSPEHKQQNPNSHCYPFPLYLHELFTAPVPLQIRMHYFFISFNPWLIKRINPCQSSFIGYSEHEEIKQAPHRPGSNCR